MWGRLESWRGRVHPKAVERSGRASEKKCVSPMCPGARFCVLSSSACKMQRAVNRADIITDIEEPTRRKTSEKPPDSHSGPFSARRTHLSHLVVSPLAPSACPCVSFRGSFAAYRHGCECKKFLPTLCLVCLAPQNEHPAWRLKTVSVRVSVSAVFYAFHLKNEASVNVCEVLLFTCARFRSTCWCEKRV
jgi:hypothetical protein